MQIISFICYLSFLRFVLKIISPARCNNQHVRVGAGRGIQSDQTHCSGFRGELFGVLLEDIGSLLVTFYFWIIRIILDA